MFAAFRSRSVSIFSKSRKQRNHRQHVRAVMEAAEPRVLLTTYTIAPVASFDTSTALGGDIRNRLIDVGGNLYGTTNLANSTDDNSVFEIKSGSTTPTVLETFTGNGSNERDDMSPLVNDGHGHLFGTTHAGGGPVEGTVYEVDTTQSTPTVTVIATFNGSAEGGIEGIDPQGALAFDSSGNLYGETKEGGANTDGSIYEIADPTGNSPTIQTLASFDDTTNGSSPDLGVVYYNGALYGANNDGPAGASPEIYKYDIGTQDLTEQVSLANDDNIAGGSLNPVIVDSNGNLFTTSNSGVSGNEDGGLFEVAPGATTYTTVATFDGSNGGPNSPNGPLTIGPDGNYYGTASSGDTTNGDIFEVDATTHAITSLGVLNDSTTGSNPYGGLVFDGNNIYGTTSSGGADDGGAVFELTAAGPPTQLVFAQQPTATQAASGDITSSSLGGAITVDVEDAQGNLITSDNSMVTISIASPSGSSLGAGSTASVSAVGGVATFDNLILDQAGTYTLAANDTDSGTALTQGLSSSFTITNASAAKLAFVTQPTTNVAIGANFGPVVVDIEDTYGNLVPNNASNVTLGINSGGASGETITGATTAAAVGGVATFNNISMPDNGTYTLSATSSGLTGGVSSSFIVGTGVNQAGPASQVVITNTPTVTPGNPTVVNAALEDQNGNVETTDNSSTITLAINGPSGVTDVPLTVTNGVATFNLSLTAPGNYSFGATSGNFTSSTTSTTTLNYAIPQAVITQPLSGVGEPTGVVIAGQKLKPFTLDLYSGDQIANAKVKVTLVVLTPSGAKAYGPVKVTTKSGSVTFKNIYFKTAANGYQLEATTAQYAPAYSTTFDVIPAAPKKMSFVTQPTPNPVTPGSPFSTSVKIVDAYGNAISNSAIVLSLKSEPKGASALGGTLTVDTANGVADFDSLTLETAGNYTLQAADGKLKATSKKFVVS